MSVKYTHVIFFLLLLGMGSSQMMGPIEKKEIKPFDLFENATLRYYPNKYERCIVNRCEAYIYPNQMFIDQNGTKIDSGRSLKNAQWKPYNLTIRKSSKEDVDVSIKDYYYHNGSIRLELDVYSEKVQNVPVRKEKTLLDLNTGKEIIEKKDKEIMDFNSEKLTKAAVYDIAQNEVLHFGMNSTTVTITPSSSNEFGCTYIDSVNPTNNFGGLGTGYIGSGLNAGTKNFFMCKFDLTGYSSSTSTVNSANVSLRYSSENWGFLEEESIYVNHVSNNFSISSLEWVDGNKTNAVGSVNEIDWNNKPTQDYLESSSSYSTISDGHTASWRNWPVTSFVAVEFAANNDDLSLLFNFSTSTLDANEKATFYTDDDATYKPYLMIDYTSTSDTCTYSGSGDWFIDCGDDCVISSTVNLANSNLIMNGTGQVFFTAEVQNCGEVSVKNSCDATIKNNIGFCT